MKRKNFASLLPTRQSTGGFTLVETAIVLAIVSLLIAAIWVAVSTVNERSRLQEAISLVTQTSQNAADYAFATSGAPAAPTQPQLIAAGVYPNGATQNPWGGNITVTFPEAARQRWSIQLTNIPNPSLCARLLALLPGNRAAVAVDPAGPWPTAVPAQQDNQKGLPTHIYLSGGGAAGWQDVTGSTPTAIATTAQNQGCNSVAFHFIR